MKFTVDSREFLDGLNIVTRALAPKQPKPVLEGVCITASVSGITLTCSDGQATFTWTGSASVSAPGQAIIHGRLLLDLIRKIPATSVTFTTDPKSAAITYGKGRSRLSVISGEYPETQNLTDHLTFSIPALALRDAIAHILPAISQNETRIILTGGLVDFYPEYTTFAALDGFRLCLKRITAQNALPAGTDHVPAIIPRKTLLDLSRSLPASDNPVTISLSQNAVQFNFDSVRISANLLTGEYVDYTRIIPERFSTSVRVNKSDFQEALDRTSIMAREGKTNLVRIEATRETLALSASAENGTVREELDCSSVGPDITIAFNSTFLSDAVRSFSSDYVTLNFTTSTAPAVISQDDSHNWFALILPVRTA